jgi:hypothetical protein|tara:strand:- start:3813 stop:4238 length:426 start_codon:yes stop_codon:yes gene_type:complete
MTMTYKFKETFTDRQARTQWDIYNCTADWHPTIRKYLYRDDEVVAKHNIEGMIRSMMLKLSQIPEERMTEEFCEGAWFMEIFYVSAIHRFFMDKYNLEEEDIDVIFRIVDNKPTLEIDYPEPNGEGDSRSPVDKLKDDLDL